MPAAVKPMEDRKECGPQSHSREIDAAEESYDPDLAPKILLSENLTVKQMNMFREFISRKRGFL